MDELILIRHGESEGNLDGSGSDSPLTDAGRSQAASLRPQLQGTRFSLVATSPLIRAVQTARLSLPDFVAVVEPRLAEFDPAPDAAFMDVSALSAQDLDELIRAPVAPPSFETGRNFMARVRSWLDELPSTGVVIAFTHYAVIREIIGSLLSSREAPSEIGHASIFRLRLDGETISRVSWNDTTHIA